MSPSPPPPPRVVLREHLAGVTALHFPVALQGHLLSCSEDGDVLLWSLSTRRVLGKFLPHGNAHLLSVVHSSEHVITQDRKGCVMGWELEAGETAACKPIFMLPCMSHSFCKMAVTSGVGVVVPHSDDDIAVWDVRIRPARPGARLVFDRKARGMCLAVHAVTDPHTHTGHVIAAFEDGSLCGWDSRQPKVQWTSKQHQDAVTSLSCSPSSLQDFRTGPTDPGNTPTHRIRIFTAGADKTARALRWDTSSPAEAPQLRHCAALDTTVGHTSLRADGRVLACACWDNTVRVFQSRNLKPLAVLSFHGSSCQAVAFSPHTGMLASGGQDTKISLWDCFIDSFSSRVEE